MFKVLHIEDSLISAALIDGMIGQKVELVLTKDLASARKELSSNQFDVLLVDLNLPDSQNLATIQALRPYFIPMIVVSIEESHNTIRKALELGVEDYITKSNLDKIDLFKHIKMVMDKHKEEVSKVGNGKWLDGDCFERVKPFISCLAAVAGIAKIG